MAKFRVEKNKDFTVMSNHHLRNKELTLKAKGLQSLMLSLPESWDYTTKGLSKICKDGIDSICATIKELEAQGYI
ncbi:MAG: helix-turn-helix domain-containing protein, partial [Clostridia bacterium]|nr:helix-turn-helix domain-containing protein [Clostridia bacterium]